MDNRIKQELGEHKQKASALTDAEIKEIFAKEYAEEFKAFEDNIRTIARGNTGLSNTWTDYLGIAGISAGTVFTNGTFALLAALKIISGFVTLGTGLAVSAAGITAGMLFRKYRIGYKRQKYQGAEEYLENELYEEARDEFKMLLERNLMPAMRNLERSQINYLVKSTIAAIANLILEQKIQHGEDLRDDNFIPMLADGINIAGGFAVNKDLMKQVINDLKRARPEFKQEAERHAVLVNAVKANSSQATGVLGMFGMFANSQGDSDIELDEFRDDDLYQVDNNNMSGLS